MFLINFVYGLSMEIVSSDYASGVLQVSTNEPGIARLTFPDLMFPYLHHHKDRIKKIEKKTNNLYVYMLIEDIIEIKYSKVLKNIHEYGWKIERGIIIPSAILYDGKQLYISNKLVDMIYIPDFTVPFLAFNTCGAVFTVVFSIFIKKRFKSK